MFQHNEQHIIEQIINNKIEIEKLILFPQIIKISNNLKFLINIKNIRINCKNILDEIKYTIYNTNFNSEAKNQLILCLYDAIDSIEYNQYTYNKFEYDIVQVMYNYYLEIPKSLKNVIQNSMIDLKLLKNWYDYKNNILIDIDEAIDYIHSINLENDLINKVVVLLDKIKFIVIDYF